MKTIFTLMALCLLVSVSVYGQTKAKPFHTSALIFPLEHWHNHASAVVEAPNGDLLVCWFHGSGERTADDVIVEGARLKKGAKQWSPRFTMADTPGYPDTNCTMFVDPNNRLWLMWPTIMANQWESALMKYKISSQWTGTGVPKWDTQEVLHVTPGQEFVDGVNKVMDQFENTNALSSEYPKENLQAYIARMRKMAADKLTRRIGWMTRAHPFVLDNKRLIVPLYSDGFSISLMAITDD